MTAPVVYLPVRWSDIQAMPPSPRRDELAYAWRHHAKTSRARSLAAAEEIPLLLARAEVARAEAVLKFDDPPALLDARRAILAAAAAPAIPEGHAA